MADEDKIQKQINEANQAMALLNNEFLWKLFDELEIDIVKFWKLVPAKDVAAREQLWVAVNTPGKIRDLLVKKLNDGKLAKQDLERLASKQG